MHLVFTGKLWTTKDIAAWNKAIRNFQEQQIANEKTMATDSSIFDVKKLGSKK
jgi:hypothetical protein